ncbi:hypothetical protein FKP32DRAFT_1670742 [Trametes sanguinea]|nr:hypothetical protein FKP32DRAFT_1670742 [Trametes sanguinea]
MIAEDDEPAERTRASLKAQPARNLPIAQSPAEAAKSSPVEETFHDARQEPSASDAVQAQAAGSMHGDPTSEPLERSPEDLTSTSVNTFHSIPLDSPRYPCLRFL